MLKISRRETFNSAHRLYNPEWTDQENLDVFGKCSYKNYHGHNYVLEVIVEGELDPSTGFILDLRKLKTVIKDRIVERFDHRNLNLDCEEFEGINPTTENVAIVIWNILRAELDKKLKIEVHLSETKKNKVIYNGDV